MKQITSATEVISKLKTSRIPQDAHGVTFALYAPGDSTLYRVSLVAMWPVESESRLPVQTCLMVVMNGDIISILRPPADAVMWTPERFISKFGEKRMGWWPAVRPLLAVLKWTPSGDRNVEFSPSDWALISAVAR